MNFYYNNISVYICYIKHIVLNVSLSKPLQSVYIFVYRDARRYWKVEWAIHDVATNLTASVTLMWSFICFVSVMLCMLDHKTFQCDIYLCVYNTSNAYSMQDWLLQYFLTLQKIVLCIMWQAVNPMNSFSCSDCLLLLSLKIY